eukprot:350940-Chlamydomonas_euryale.AAC.5
MMLLEGPGGEKRHVETKTIQYGGTACKKSITRFSEHTTSMDVGPLSAILTYPNLENNSRICWKDL